LLVGRRAGADGLGVGVVAPVGLHRHGVDLIRAGGFDAAAHGFDDGAHAEVPHGTQDAFRRAQDEEGILGEGVEGVKATGLPLPHRFSWQVVPALIKPAKFRKAP
jgi:hypothetical protein